MYTQWDAPAPDVADITVFRSYVQDLHTKLTTHGLTHMSPIPNQFNFTSEPDPANDALTGLNKTYRPLYYTFSDDLIPTFIKIEFFKVNSGSNAANRQRLLSRVTISTSIDVNGNQFNIVAQYTNSNISIGQSTTYTVKNGDSIVYGNTTPDVVKFGVISTPRYAYDTAILSLAVVYMLIERTVDEVAVWGNTLAVSSNFITNTPNGIIPIALYVGSRQVTRKTAGRLNPNISNDFLATSGQLLLQSYIPNISSNSGITRVSNTVYYYNKSGYTDGSINIVAGKTYFMLGNYMSHLTTTTDCGIAILIGD